MNEFIETLGQSLTVGLLILAFGMGMILVIGIILDTIELIKIRKRKG